MTVRANWEIHKGDVGTLIRLIVTDHKGAVVDVSSATTKQILLQRPNGSVEAKAAVFSTDGSDGAVQYVTQAGDLDQVGDGWRAQARLASATQDFKTQWVEFEVKPNLQ